MDLGLFEWLRAEDEKLLKVDKDVAPRLISEETTEPVKSVSKAQRDYLAGYERLAQVIRAWLLTGGLGYGLYQGGRILKKAADSAFPILDAVSTGGKIAGYVGPAISLGTLIFKWLRS